MSVKEEILATSYYEKAGEGKTWSGYPVKEFYGPDDLTGKDYHKEIGDPGEYPYTRGIHRNMYRGRLWTRREVCGLGSAADTNERVKFLIKEGAGGPNVIVDLPGELGIDADHPLAIEEAGRAGVSLNSQRDMEILTADIPLEKISFSLIVASTSALALLPQYFVEAERRGIEFCNLRGSIQNDPVHLRYCGFRPANPLDLAVKTAVDIIEYCARCVKQWYPTTINLYDLREQGINAAQEVAFGFGIGLIYVDKALERGLTIDDFAPRLTFYCSSHIDFFEEVAKLRAARRLWAKIMKERYGAKDPRSLKFRFAVHTAGCSLVPQQPLNNIIRIAYEALAAVLAGVQSLHCCAYDEPICLPTEASHRLAIRTQQILAYETGVANASDPLGGSYYVEALTDQIEAEAARLLKEIEAQGGMYQAVATGWLDRELEKAALEEQRRVENKERLMVGANVFQIPPESETPGGVQRIPEGKGEEIAAGVRKLRQERNNLGVRKALESLCRAAERGEKENLIPHVMECLKAEATMGEIMGTIREVYGYAYDPFGVLDSPFKL